MKVQLAKEGQQPEVIILSDSGTGLDVPNEEGALPTHQTTDESLTQMTKLAERWNIATFLERTLNAKHALPYIVISTHCHYDHICGIQHLLDAKTDLTILASSNDPTFITPWSSLQKHSLCDRKSLAAPRYDANFIEDTQRIGYIPRGLDERRDSSITVIHTPGHTPDSLSWYDHETLTLCVGDTFYERESDETRSGSGGHWPQEPALPVIFTKDSNIINWNASMHRLLDFVRHENQRMGTDASGQAADAKPRGYRQDGQGVALDFTERPLYEEDWSLITETVSRRRVALCAAHVTIATDAEFALLNMLAFMLRIQLDQVPKKRANDTEGNNDTWLWDDSLLSSPASSGSNKHASDCQFSVQAPWSIIHRASSTNAATQASPLTRSKNPNFRSMIQQMTSTQRSDQSSSLKTNALASVSHSSVMADLPAVKAASIARKG